MDHRKMKETGIKQNVNEENMQNSHSNKGLEKGIAAGCGCLVGILILLIQLVLIILKLCKVISWNWWIVLLPILVIGAANAVTIVSEIINSGKAKEEAKKMQTLAEMGNVDAQHKLGLFYLDGKGVPKNDALAAEWLGKAAAQGHSEAQYNLGYMYENGFGVPKDLNEAVKWYRKSAEPGGNIAEVRLKILGFSVNEEVHTDERNNNDK